MNRSGGRAERIARAGMLGAAVLTCGACGGGQKTAAFRPAFVQNGDAVVYVYRPADPWEGGGIQVFMDQKPIGDLAPGQYIAQVVPPGEYLIRAEGASDAVQRVVVLGGESIYLQTLNGGFPFGTTRLERRETEEGRQLIAGTFEAPGHGAQAEATPANPPPNSNK